MSNVPQDVLEDALLAGFEVFKRPDGSEGIETFDAGENITDDLLKFLQLRAQRSNAEPVAIVTVGSQDHGPFSYRETAYGIDHLPDGETKLYTTPPDAGFAAGMMKAAEIVHAKGKSAEAVGWLEEAEELLYLGNEIISAIPADSQAALREVCMKVAIQVYVSRNIISRKNDDADLKAIVDAKIGGNDHV